MPYSPWQIKAITRNFLTTTLDLTLFLTAFSVGLVSAGRSSKGVHEAASWAEGITYDAIVRSIKHGRAKGWIKRDLTVSHEGQRRLQSLFPHPHAHPKRWGGVWHLVSFDIPRTLNYKRNQLRGVLKKLGFGKLHESLWIHPYPMLGDVMSWAKTAKVEDYLLPATSSELGKQHSRDLAARVWNLDELNLRYAKWNGAMVQEKKTREELFFEYLAMVADDPFLPQPLLPEDWYGQEAHTRARKEFPQMRAMWKEQATSTD